MRTVRLTGLKGWLLVLVILVGIIISLVLLFLFFAFLLPAAVLLVLIGMVFSLWHRKNKDLKTDAPKKDYIDVKHKVKEK